MKKIPISLIMTLASELKVLVIILFALLLFNYSSLDKVEIKIREVQELNRQIAGQEKKLNINVVLSE